MYGNSHPEAPESTRLFPFILSKLCDYFSYPNSRFTIHRAKEATARVTMWRELKMPCIYTMEASFCGASKGKQQGIHFSTRHLMESGRSVGLGLIVYCDIDVPKSVKELQIKRKKSPEEEKKEESEPLLTCFSLFNRKDLVNELLGNKNLLTMGEGKEDDSDDGSDSDPSEDNLEEDEIIKILPISKKKKKVIEARKKQLMSVNSFSKRPTIDKRKK